MTVTDTDARAQERRFYAFMAYAFVPTPASRVRLVHIPESDRRKELMIVYLEAAGDAGDISPEEAEALIGRAVDGLTLSSTH